MCKEKAHLFLWGLCRSKELCILQRNLYVENEMGRKQTNDTQDLWDFVFLKNIARLWKTCYLFKSSYILIISLLKCITSQRRGYSNWTERHSGWFKVTQGLTPIWDQVLQCSQHECDFHFYAITPSASIS